MKKTLNELKEKAQKLTLSQTVYPALSAIFVILIIVLFILAVRTISTLINGTVTEGPSSSEVSVVDSEEFLIVARKLGIPQEAASPTSATPTQQPEASEVARAQETLPVTASTGSTTETLDPKELTIAIYNGTTIKGSASRLKALIEKEGFVVAQTGNASKPASAMTLELKESRSAYQELLVQALGKIYAPEVITSDLPEDGAYDAIITIGEAQ
ncbi:MAG: hypothetical protein A2494_01050 [Candidatus Lloydbacteria bacterium RIFOXYC12_FULL_46_25]|uniref:LytR/CpsA/Psr regulator C-terminal domain-containing protein n=1 Tax=Candidatus Lloydbacteria bacterium RIFOXYC12_FULL_46_25 TaxID=1798670 RepID=A0A1G2E1Q5_9BACT|nr:MAG: hypothetical protein A2494_01050 [Candidatus Lloydbacteria bacterium RIFOXYC12_FULL_46_25]